jgi:hypothetical protein
MLNNIVNNHWEQYGQLAKYCSCLFSTTLLQARRFFLCIIPPLKWRQAGLGTQCIVDFVVDNDSLKL